MCKYTNDAATGMRIAGLGAVAFGIVTAPVGGLAIAAIGGALASGASIGDKIARVRHRCGCNDEDSFSSSRDWTFDTLQRGASSMATYRASSDLGKSISIFAAKSAVGFVCPPCESALDLSEIIIDAM